MGRALYRKYRSKSLDEIVGQPHITTTLKNAIKNGAVSHAYLFTGPHGVGKTSIARILAHEVNQLEYTDDATHLDIIEIDAASNRRIDEIRDLRERVHIAPTSSTYKVYIIDEVHMLTKEAFNALLKTLEEPPAHVIFILATTEAHKLPETIVSRTQRFTFKPVERQAVVDHLRQIAKAEKITIDDDALELIAAHGGGTFRDSISLLDQVRGHADAVNVSHIQSILGIAPDQAIDSLVQVTIHGTPAELVAELQTLREQGYQPAQIAKQLANRLRERILANEQPLEAAELTELLHKLIHVPAAYDPSAALELALLHVVLQHTQAASPATKQPPKVEQPIVAEPVVKTKPKSQAPEPITEMPAEPIQAPSGQDFDLDVWNTILDTIKKTHNTLYSVSRMATPRIDGDNIILQFQFAFHQKKLNDTKNKQIITDIIKNVTGKPLIVSCVISGETDNIPAKPEPAKTDDTITNISNIFGGAEVLE